MSKFRSIVSAVLAVVLVSAPAFAQVSVDSNLPDYTPVQGVTGSIKSVGSDTMNNMMTLWAEGFKTMYPNVQVEIEGKGSSTAPPALISATSNFGPMSRSTKSKEDDAFEKAEVVHKNLPHRKRLYSPSFDADGKELPVYDGDGKRVTVYSEDQDLYMRTWDSQEAFN